MHVMSAQPKSTGDSTLRRRTMILFDYIEGFYNPHRRHSTLGNISPAAFEKQALRA
jgi:transposase InsO family protein